MRLRMIILLCFLTLSLIGRFDYYLMRQFPYIPLNATDTPVTFNLTKGSGTKTITKQLQTQGVVNAWQGSLLRLWVRSQKAEKLLKAGEYQLSSHITPDQLLIKLIRGDVIQYELMFSEGLRFEQAMGLIQNHPAIKKTLQNKSLSEIMFLLGEKEVHPEGLFFPDTYYFIRDTTDIEILRRARQIMQNRLLAAWEQRSPGIVVKTPYEALILASIIEKEAKGIEERCLISGVFQRRLAKNMRLQADPTVIYGLGKEYSGNLTQAQLKQASPYNTYINKGLPPTPIALPGITAITAALHPDNGETLYFVAKGDGSHHFSVTLKDHNEAVKKYQLGE